MNKFKLAAGVILIFLVGALAGSLGTGQYIRHGTKDFGREIPSPNRRKTLFMKKVSSELDLTESQRTEIGKIVEESDAKVMAIRRQYLPEIKKIWDHGFELISGKLKPGQQKKFDALKRKIERRHSRAFINSILIRKRPGQILSNLKESLNLNDDQVVKVRPIIENNYEGLNRIVKEYREKDRPDLFSIRRDVQDLQNNTEKELAAILSKDQMEAYIKIQR